MSTYSHDHSKRFRHTGAVVPLLRLAWRSDRNSSGGERTGAKVRVWPSWWSSVDCTSWEAPLGLATPVASIKDTK